MFDMSFGRILLAGVAAAALVVLVPGAASADLGNVVGSTVGPVTPPPLPVATTPPPVVTTTVKPVVTTVVTPVTKPVAPVVKPVVKPVVDQVVAPVVKPVAQTVVKPVVKAAAPVVQPVVKAVTAPVASATRPVSSSVRSTAASSTGAAGAARRARPGAVPGRRQAPTRGWPDRRLVGGCRRGTAVLGRFRCGRARLAQHRDRGGGRRPRLRAVERRGRHRAGRSVAPWCRAGAAQPRRRARRCRRAGGAVRGHTSG